MADKLLEIKDLEVLYKSGKNPVHAVNGISLTLNKGETLGLVGETGAGKTTTALAILRLLPERTGCINQGWPPTAPDWRGWLWHWPDRSPTRWS